MDSTQVDSPHGNMSWASRERRTKSQSENGPAAFTATRYHQAAATDNQPREKHATALNQNKNTWQNQRGEPNSNTTKKQSDFFIQIEQDSHETQTPSSLPYLIIKT
jgi:hypothetical protein